MTNSPLPSEAQTPEALIQELFDQARKVGGLDYTLTLLRVEGIDERPDPLTKLETVVSMPWEDLPPQARREIYCGAATLKDPLNLLWNLMSVASGRRYKPFPFDHLIEREEAGYRQPTPRDLAGEILKLSREIDKPLLRAAVARTYSGLLEGFCEEAIRPELNDRELFHDDYPRQFWKALVETYFESRKRFGSKTKLVKWPRFEVAEFLCDDELGLYGLRVYFSNGNSAEWIRRREYATSINLSLQEVVGFFVGRTDTLKREWWVGDKRLHEIGLPGRYNKLGEWRPIVYEGSTDWMDREIQALSNDPDVQGALFYIYCTAHWLIEFVVRADVDLPFDGPIQFGSIKYPANLSKCAHQEDWDPHIRLYDGWAFVPSPNVDEIENVLYSVGVAIGRVAFTFGANISWRLKYRAVFNPANPALAKPNKTDVALLDRVLVELPYIVDFAIDWHNRGRASRNPFTAFLCYFVAIEIIVEAAYDGEEDIGIHPDPMGRVERRRKRIECIQQKHEELFASEPEAFVRTAYFECVVPLSQRRRQVCEAVFGFKHPAMAAFFGSKGRESLTAIRNQLAHGRISLVHREHEASVRERLGELSGFSKEFLMRVILKLRPEDECPSWSREFTMGASTSDPRTTKVTTTLDIFPRKDWSIRPEWCE